MNKLNLYRFATAAMTVASLSACSDSNSDDSPTPAPVVNHVTMTFTAGQGTRAAFTTNEGGKTNNEIVWEKDEKLRVFPDYRDEDYKLVKPVITLTSASRKTSGTFTGDVAISDFYAAIYPNQTTASLSDNSLSSTDATINHISVSSVQNATEGTFDPSAGVMVSTTTAAEKNFKFKNLCAFLRIVPKYNCNTITVQSKNTNEYLSGSVTANYSEDNLTWTEEQISKTTTVAASNKVTLVGNMTAGKAYYIAVLPNNLANGFSVTLEDCDNKITRYVNSQVTFERNNYYDISGAFPASSTSGTPISRPTFVDLGLPSETLWATCNLGATNDYESGSYYAWGEIAAMGEADPYNVINKEIYNTDIKCFYDWDSYKWGDGSDIESYESSHMNKYNNTDNKTTLETADDAAAAASSKYSSCGTTGYAYRMPTKAEFEELMTKCYWEFSENYNGVKGYFVYGRKTGDSSTTYNKKSESVTYTTTDTHIFLPCSGFLNETSTQNEGAHGYYWSSTLDTSYKNSYKAYSLLISNVNQKGNTPTYKAELHGDFRRGGQCIRPVKQ